MNQPTYPAPQTDYPQRRIARFSWQAMVKGLLACAIVVSLNVIPAASQAAPTATTWYVAPSASGGNDSSNCLTPETPCEHIQNALGNASAGDTIIIAPGTYFENLSISESVTLHGADQATTFIDGQALGTTMEIKNATVNMSGLTVRNGQNAYGAGLSIGSLAAAIVSNSRIISNTGSGGGGAGIANQGSLKLINVTVSNNINNGNDNGGGLRNLGSAELINSVISNNQSVASNAGGIYNRGVLTVTNSTLSGNRAGAGGAIYNQNALILNNTLISHNQANSSAGGGIYNSGLGFNPGVVLDSGSIIADNVAATSGGGVHNASSGNLVFNGTSILSNTASSAFGGGLYSEGAASLTTVSVTDNRAVSGGGLYNDLSGHLLVAATTVKNNSVSSTGGGINNRGTLTVTQSALVYNTASAAPGGGLHNAGTAAATLTNVTISDNTATAGGGIQNDDGTLQINFSTISNITGTPALNNASGSVFVANSILTQIITNTVCGGTITSAMHNIDSGTSCRFSLANLDYSSTDPKLGPLQDNGGNSLTRAIAFSSPARDTASSCPPPEDVDQRGISRPQGNGCDRGAYEVIGYSGTGTDILPNQCVNATLPINASIVIGRAQVGVNLSYGDRVDLTVNVFAPGNRKVVLLGPASSSGKDLNTLFDDDAATGVPNGPQDAASSVLYEFPYKPSTPLALLRGTNLKGTWKLEICNSSNNTGTLNRWALVVPEASNPKVYLPLIRRGK